MENIILPALQHQINTKFLYNKPIPKSLKRHLVDYFFDKVASFIRIVDLDQKKKFFLENNKLYIFVTLKNSNEKEKRFILNIPADILPRFYQFEKKSESYIVFLDDIVKMNIKHIFPHHRVVAASNLKVTRSGELEIDDEYEGDLATKIEAELQRRDKGLATRLLYEGSLSSEVLKFIRKKLKLSKANFVKGGPYHNMKDLRQLPLRQPGLYYKPWKPNTFSFQAQSIFGVIARSPFLIHTPYHSYDPLIRFFNEASLDKNVTTIYTTMYRIHKNSAMAHALINAVKNGKKVWVFIELKARFDEENNLKWAKKMATAGVKIIFSIPEIKVHCKLALVKRKEGDKDKLYGVLGTGNFHESNLSLYTDHFYFTTEENLLNEVETIFRYLRARKKGVGLEARPFRKLLVGQFNLREKFLELIENEINNAVNNLPASVTIKVNALEERTLIDKLYAASQAGVKVNLIVRGICCLVPGVAGMSENITVRRIVDRYLEHGRIFVFENAGDPVVILGSSDLMRRSMYRRIEVCFPLANEKHKREIIHMMNLWLADDHQAVLIDSQGNNVPIPSPATKRRRAQREIHDWLLKQPVIADEDFFSGEYLI